MGFSADSRAVCMLLISFAVLVNASNESDEILKALKDMATLTTTLRDVASDINLVNTKEKAPKILQALNALNTRTGDITYYSNNKMKGTSSDNDAKPVLSSLSSLRYAQRQSLEVVAQLPNYLFPVFSTTGNQEKIRLALVTLESAVKSFTCELVCVVPSQRDAAEQQFRFISASVTDAVNAYSQGPGSQAL